LGSLALFFTTAARNQWFSFRCNATASTVTVTTLPLYSLRNVGATSSPTHHKLFEDGPATSSNPPEQAGQDDGEAGGCRNVDIVPKSLNDGRGEEVIPVLENGLSASLDQPGLEKGM